MELIATFVPSGKTGYRIAFLLTDARTTFGRTLLVSSEEQVVAVIRKLNGEHESAQTMLTNCGQGCAHVWPSETQMEWLRKHG